MKFCLVFLSYFLFCGYANNVFAQSSLKLEENNYQFPKTQSPNYSDLKSWAAHPNKEDNADKLPKNNLSLKNAQKDALVDVFFIHPTSYTEKPLENFEWNAPIDNEELNQKTDNGAILNQASVFNGSCRVFAPRYRQAHIKAFYIKNNMSKNALDLACSDVKMAFEYYLKNENKGRPIVIASHSQGTVHAQRLLQDYFDGKELQKQLVTAYLVGFPTRNDMFQTISASYKPNETGGYESWYTYQENYYPPNYEVFYKDAEVVNPMVWTKDSTWISENKNLGIVNAKFELIEKVLTARTKGHILWIKTPFVFGRMLYQRKNWHIADYNLFWMNTRENVALRIKEFKTKSFKYE